MTIYIAGPDGEPLAFANEAEVDAYRRARREAEPPWLRRLRQRHADVCRLYDKARYAGMERSGPKAAFPDIECGLRDLCSAMKDDIKAAERNEDGGR
jgi:hypothetical protein